jgi:Na+-translocating ferredoxin:NAD+ oxidoreductase RnfE subunit
MSTRRNRQLALIVLGLCPAVVASTRVLDALFLAAGTVLVLAAMSVLLPLLRTLGNGDASAGKGGGAGAPGAVLGAGAPGATPAPGETPPGALPPRVVWGGLLLSSCLTAVFELALNALAPAVSSRLGIYVPLIAVSFLTAARLDALSSAASLRGAAADAARIGAWFSFMLVAVSVVREVLGSGTITLGTTIPVAPFFADPARAAGFAGGALICLGYAAGAARLLTRSRARDGAAADDVGGNDEARDGDMRRGAARGGTAADDRGAG